MQLLECTTESTSRHRLLFVPAIEKIADGYGMWQHTSPLSNHKEQLFEALHHAIREHLTDKQRQAIELHFFEGLSQGEIARREGISQQVVQKRLYGTIRKGRRVGGAMQKLHDALVPFFSPSSEQDALTTSP